MLTDLMLRGLKPAKKPYKKADRDGLYIFVTPAGGKSWRMKYHHGGKEQRLTFGAYPKVTLAEAREKCRAARQQLRDKVNPNRAPSTHAPTGTQPLSSSPANGTPARLRAGTSATPGTC